MTGDNRPYKLVNNLRNKRVGVVVKSLADLKKKAKAILELNTKVDLIRIVLDEDGTAVEDEDYFSTLPGQTVFIALDDKQRWKPAENATLTDLLSSLLLSRSKPSELASKVAALTKEAHLQEILTSVLTQYVEPETVRAESKSQHPDWFEGIDGRFNTKSHYMQDSARRRVRGYLKLLQELGKDNEDEELEDVIMAMTELLKQNQFHQVYFDRTASKSADCLCDATGKFVCQGPYNKTKCPSRHTINPYASRDLRIAFSTWNLDHRIEKSREVLPSLVQAIASRSEQQRINVQYFYDLLFTRKNLKLVTIVCHDKTVHVTQKCNKTQFYI